MFLSIWWGVVHLINKKLRGAGLRGPWTLFKKELLRFWRVSFQTVAAPVMTALLYLLIFSHVLEGRVQVYPGVGYTA